jgi:hypothetical protein
MRGKKEGNDMTDTTIRWAGYGGVRGSLATHDTETVHGRPYRDGNGDPTVILTGGDYKPSNRSRVTIGADENGALVYGRRLRLLTSRGLTTQPMPPGITAAGLIRQLNAFEEHRAAMLAFIADNEPTDTDVFIRHADIATAREVAAARLLAHIEA